MIIYTLPRFWSKHFRSSISEHEMWRYNDYGWVLDRFAVTSRIGLNACEDVLN